MKNAYTNIAGSLWATTGRLFSKVSDIELREHKGPVLGNEPAEDCAAFTQDSQEYRQHFKGEPRDYMPSAKRAAAEDLWRGPSKKAKLEGSSETSTFMTDASPETPRQ